MEAGLPLPSFEAPEVRPWYEPVLPSEVHLDLAYTNCSVEDQQSVPGT